MNTEMTSDNVPATNKVRSVQGKVHQMNKNIRDKGKADKGDKKSKFMDAFKKKYGNKATSKAKESAPVE